VRTNIQTVKELLTELGRAPNKALGQNFFVDGPRLQSLADAMNVDGAAVLEIGAGLGALTELLLPRAQTLYAVELDSALCDILRRFKDPKLQILCGDCLKLDYSFLPPDFVAAGNLPYYITTPIAEMLLTLNPSEITLMVQKEAAARFFAAPGDKTYGPVAILSQLFYEPKLLAELPESCYWPQPTVRSCVVQLRKRDRFQIPDSRHQDFLSFIKQCLRMRRKTLLNNLKGWPAAASILEQMNLSPSIRAEALTPEQFLTLFRELKTKNQ